MADPMEALPTEAERRTLRDLARGVIRAQGNVFIKELLRSKQIRIGATKEDFERNLFEAIENGQLRLADAEAWLEEIEGWGNQHVFLYTVPEDLSAKGAALSSPEAMRRKVKEADLEKYWEVSTSQAFPLALELTAIRFDGQVLRLIWHEGDTTWARGNEEKKLDRPLDIGLDHYELRAYRQMARRNVMRFEMRLPDRLAAIFLSSNIKESDHVAAVNVVVEVLRKLFDVRGLLDQQVLIGDVIKKLDQAVAGGAKRVASAVRAHSTRLTGKAAYIELGSSTEMGSYLDDPTIGSVRTAIRAGELRKLAGTSATFEILQQGLPPLSQDVRLQLYGPQKRVRIWKLLRAEEVWAILKLLAR